MKRFNQLTKQEKMEYLAILFLLPFAYIGHLFRKANFRTLPKRAVAVCLSAVMVITILPIMSITANAANPDYTFDIVETYYYPQNGSNPETISLSAFQEGLGDW